MWRRFTEPARRVVFYAQEEAQRLGHGAVSPDHLLLGLLREPDIVACRLLARFGVTVSVMRDELTRLTPQGDTAVESNMALSADAKKTIELAFQEAERLGNSYLGTEHLLLGLLRQEDGLPARLLRPWGVNGEEARQEVARLQKEKENA